MKVVIRVTRDEFRDIMCAAQSWFEHEHDLAREQSDQDAATRFRDKASVAYSMKLSLDKASVVEIEP